jgi:hypothetical protein
MVFALGAGKLFDIHHAGEFEETILGKSQTSEAPTPTPKMLSCSTFSGDPWAPMTVFLRS